MEYEDQRCLGLFLLELKRHWEKLLKNTATQVHPQRTITTFFSPITPTNATSQSRDTQMGSRPGHNKGVIIDRAIAICRACGPQPHEPRPKGKVMRLDRKPWSTKAIKATMAQLQD